MKTQKEENLKCDQEQIADLSITDEQADQTKGGPTLNITKPHITYLEQDHK